MLQLEVCTLHSISNFTSFLTSSVLVTGAVLVGTANCTVQNMLIQVNSSIQPIDSCRYTAELSVISRTTSCYVFNYMYNYIQMFL